MSRGNSASRTPMTRSSEAPPQTGETRLTRRRGDAAPDAEQAPGEGTPRLAAATVELPPGGSLPAQPRGSAPPSRKGNLTRLHGMAGRRCCAALLLMLPAAAQTLRIERTPAGTIEVRRAGAASPLLVQNAPTDMRPYLHPLMAPDGKGVLTQFRPGHHLHQTGIYFGFSAVNGRSFFHNTDGAFFRGKGARVEKGGAWSVETDWLAGDGSVLLTETQRWRIEDFVAHYVLDLDWTGRAAVDVTIGKYDYGGLFVRMPWKAGIQGDAINSEGQSKKDAEGKRARWVDVGMEIEGRPDQAHIAMLDHRSNPDHPVPWRVDANLGIVPSRSRLGDWKIAKGESARARYRLVVYTGELNRDLIERNWTRWEPPSR
jgi:hypothetical protein